MNNKNTSPNHNRTPSTDNPHSSNSLETVSSFFHFGRTNRSSQTDDAESASPYFGASPSRRTDRSGGSNRSNLEIVPNSASSSLSLGSKFHPDVSDWNERVHQDTRRSLGDVPGRLSTDPPRPARRGFEWVWYPGGYWAERERPTSPVKPKKSRRWFVNSPDRKGNSSPSSSSPARNKSPLGTDIPQITIGGTSSNESSSRASRKSMEDKGAATDAPGSKLKRGVHYMSPTDSHSTALSGHPEGLFSKFKRRFKKQIMGKSQTVPLLSLAT